MEHLLTRCAQLPANRLACAAIIAAAVFTGTLRPAGRELAARPTGKPAATRVQNIPQHHGEWPQWRGVDRDGRVSAPAPPGSWPAQASRLWVRQVGEGYSGPVAAGDRVWIHSRRGTQEVVASLLLTSGEVVWTAAYEAPFQQDDNAKAHGLGPYSTPSISDGRLFTMGVTGVVSAWHAATGGFRPVREYRLGDSICWAHPALVGDRILVRDGSRLAAYQFATR
jgi:hypothetical protein